VKHFAWDNAKNGKLRAQRILFEDIVFHIERGDVLDILHQAHEDVVLFRLCRVYDQELNALSLRTLLLRIQETPADARPNEGVASALGASELMNNALEPAIAADLEFVEQSSNDRVKRLMMWRHKEIAHRDETFALQAGSRTSFPSTGPRSSS